MTVAAIVIVPDASIALADADGEPAIRRIVQVAWAGGALPVVVVSPDADPSGLLAAALADLPATLAPPEDGDPHDTAWFVRGMKAASAEVGETAAALLWPGRYCWVDPETVTSLIQAHGQSPQAILRPAYAGEPGFPVLVPVDLRDRLAAVATLHTPEAIEAVASAGALVTVLEMGDPGIVKDAATPRTDLPGYQGPPPPVEPAAR